MDQAAAQAATTWALSLTGPELASEVTLVSERLPEDRIAAFVLLEAARRLRV